MKNIGVVDWFTKKRETIEYPGDCDTFVNRFVMEISHEFGGKDLWQVSDRVYRTLHRSEFFRQICSDTRLPVCSLFHHSKNTGAIACCLAYDKIQKEQGFISDSLAEYDLSDQEISPYNEKNLLGLIRIGSLLHDIGKPRSFSEAKKGLEFYEHIPVTRKIIEEILAGGDQGFISKFALKKILPSLASQHHGKDANTRLERLIHRGDTVSSAADRMYEVSYEYQQGILTISSEDVIFPHEINADAGVFSHQSSRQTQLLGVGEKREFPVTLREKHEYGITFSDRIIQGGPTYYDGSIPPRSGTIRYISLDIMQIQDFINESDKLPQLRGASAIVEEILTYTRECIAQKLGEEVILFSGGGNLLALLPTDQLLYDELKNKISRHIEEKTQGALRAAIVTNIHSLDTLAGKFHLILEDAQQKLEEEKNSPRTETVIRPATRGDMCTACNRRLANGVYAPGGDVIRLCTTCLTKQNQRTPQDIVPITLMRENRLTEPQDLTELGPSIAVIAVDGNMMGRLFMNTLTPAEYSYKSEEFDLRFRNIVKTVISEFVTEDLDRDKTESLIRIRGNGKSGQEVLGIEPIYLGGDDLLLIVSARAALPLTHRLVSRIADEFRFSWKMADTTDYSNPTVTISAGIAIADSKFPIYFLLDMARKMEGKAKEAFRKGTITDELRIIKIPDGAIGVTAVTGAMGGDASEEFVFPKDDKKFEMLLSLLDKSIGNGLQNDGYRRIISDLIRCGELPRDKLDFLKFSYAAGFRKTHQPETWLDICDKSATVLLPENKPVLTGLKLVVPHIWHMQEEN